ncbi:TPA: hypothetical protein N0F65_007311 [Lagenidium giganteum]|uniref:Protein kinase domain-containing protein n=1 Tax=Lagenidium giganteum TaxID=4803 RepID=A0AAV2Z780_9STRA|nr:TPA: hypothetical protein N0F65_007311 [Lagenidium giganteum]
MLRISTLEKLGDTMSGDVWRAEYTLRATHKAVVAIKHIDMVKARRSRQWFNHGDDPAQERWAIERIWDAGGHRNILHVHAVMATHHCMIITMDFCEGGDLLALVHLAPERRLLEDTALHLFRQVVAGVHFLHENGIAHRDLSLENVLLSGGIVKICDFGLSAPTDSKCSNAVGKAYYMAPEVVALREYDPASADLWSLGIILFILLSGSPAFDCASVDDASFEAFKRLGVRQILEGWGVAVGISESTLQLLEGLFEIDPTKRLTMAKVQAHLVMK